MSAPEPTLRACSSFLKHLPATHLVVVDLAIQIYAASERGKWTLSLRKRDGDPPRTAGGFIPRLLSMLERAGDRPSVPMCEMLPEDT